MRPSQKAKLDEAMAAAAEATGNSHPLLSGYQYCILIISCHIISYISYTYIYNILYTHISRLSDDISRLSDDHSANVFLELSNNDLVCKGNFASKGTLPHTTLVPLQDWFGSNGKGSGGG